MNMFVCVEHINLTRFYLRFRIALLTIPCYLCIQLGDFRACVSRTKRVNVAINKNADRINTPSA